MTHLTLKLFILMTAGI